jgi:hypothetical protein
MQKYRMLRSTCNGMQFSYSRVHSARSNFKYRYAQESDITSRDVVIKYIVGKKRENVGCDHRQENVLQIKN